MTLTTKGPTTQPQGPPSINRWWLVAAGFSALMIQQGLRFAFGVVLPFMVVDMGRVSTVALAYSIHLLLYTATAPAAGRALDRLPTRPVVVTGAVVSSLAVFGIGFTNGPTAMILLFGVVLGPASHAFGVIAANRPVARLFEDKRGLALGVTSSGVSFGAAFLPAVAGLVAGAAGWRAAWMVMGALMLLVLLPSSLLLGIDLGEDTTLAQDAKSSIDTDVSLHRQKRFWILFAGFFSAMVVQQSIVLQLANDGYSRGLTTATVASAMIVLAITGVIARVGLSWVSDQLVDRVRITIPGTALVVAGLGCLAVTTGRGGYWAAILFLGGGMSIYGPLFAAIAAERFPDRPYATTLGSLVLGAGLGGAIGPFIIARLLDGGMPLSRTWALLIPMSLFSVAAFLRPSPLPNAASAPSHTHDPLPDTEPQ